jgi:hypothetical protein
MSMAVFTPVFPYLSATVGLAIGFLLQSLALVVIVAIKYRDFPIHLVQRALISLSVIALASVITFSLFRVAYGMPNFNIFDSVRHAVLELFVYRADFFGLGFFVGTLLTYFFFWSGFLQRMRREHKPIFEQHSFLRGVKASWQ